MNLTEQEILVTGGNGFLGKYVINELMKHGISERQIHYPPSSVYDFRKATDCKRAVRDRDVVIHLAGNVGGIQYNQKYPATLFDDNLSMGFDLMRESRMAGVKKFVTIGTVCSYPKHTPIPFSEGDLWRGYPEETNAPYGLAKKMLLIQGQAYRQQHRFNAIYLIPVNLYGPGDNFDDSSSHVIPALIKKVAEAKNIGQKFVEVWGTGEASREFLYVEDAAEAIVLATRLYNEPEPVNIGAGRELKIKDLVSIICDLMDFDGEIRWNITKPDGQPRRCLDVTRAKEKFGFTAKTSFEDGLRKTIDWYLDDLK